MKRFLIVLAILLPLSDTFAQSDADAIRYSLTNYGTTARSAAMGGAFGSLGGDMGAIGINPAGVGVFRSSTISISPNFGSINSETTYGGNSLTGSSKYNFNLNNWGLVFTSNQWKKAKSKENGWVSGGVAFGGYRLADFNGEYFAAGYNEDNSILDAYIEDVAAQGGILPDDMFSSNPYGFGLAYDGYLLNPLTTDSSKYSSVIPAGQVEQQLNMSTTGAHDEYYIAVGGNYANKMFIGGSVGFPSIRYRETKTYSEADINDSIADFQDFTQVDNLRTDGQGVNFKLGLIFKPVENIRVGASFHSPTWMYMNDEYWSNLTTNFVSTGREEYQSNQTGYYEYSLVTPWRMNAGLSMVQKGLGIFSLDYEFTDHSKNYYDFSLNGTAEDQLIENETNQLISQKYSSSHNVRVGVEIPYEIFRFRAGYGLRTSPFADNIVSTEQGDLTQKTLGLGVGMRDRNYFIDFSYQNRKTDSYYKPYNLADDATPGITNNENRDNFTLTLGLKF